MQFNSFNTGTILIAEDEADVRTLIMMILKEAGYQVLESRNGTEALLVASHYDGLIHLLLTDFVMPGMNGSDLAEKLKAERPEMSVLFMSGYTDRAFVTRGFRINEASVLRKPFGPDALMARVRTIIDDQQTRDAASPNLVAAGTPVS